MTGVDPVDVVAVFFSLAAIVLSLAVLLNTLNQARLQRKDDADVPPVMPKYGRYLVMDCGKDHALARPGDWVHVTNISQLGSMTAYRRIKVIDQNVIEFYPVGGKKDGKK